MSPGARESDSSQMARIVDRNIDAILARRREYEKGKRCQDKIADTITRFTGSLPFVYLHLVIFGSWIFINLGWVPGVPRFDATFVVLAMVASVEAIFLSTFVLISQNRMAAMADKRADLDLQISLLAEHEVTHLIHLVSAMAEKMGLEESQSSELHELKRAVSPEAVLDRIEKAEAREL